MKKKINWILIVVVAGLWSVIIYRLVSNMVVNNNSIKNKNYYSFYETAKITDKDTFILPEKIADPFLENRSINLKIPKKKKSLSKPKKTLNLKTVTSPSTSILRRQISFHGYFYNSVNKNESLVVKIDGKLFTVRVKDNVNGVQFLDRKGDSIKVTVDRKEIRWVKKLTSRQ